jgi:hypothetical protein
MWSEQKHEKLSLITAFLITHQGILNLTTDDNLIAVGVYVAYRKPFPNNGTVERVKKELKKNNIEYSELEDFSMENCNFADSSSEEGNSDSSSQEGNSDSSSQEENSDSSSQEGNSDSSSQEGNSDSSSPEGNSDSSSQEGNSDSSSQEGNSE